MHDLRKELLGESLRIKTALMERMYIPCVESGEFQYTPDQPFMIYSTPGAADILHPRYREICSMICTKPIFHRKQWEWVYIIHHLSKSGLVKACKRGIVFGVGREQLPSLFASFGATIVCTDAPVAIGEKSGWNKTNQHSSNLDSLFYDNIVSKELFYSQVSFLSSDMTNIDSSLKEFDFTWSSCSLEHLGSLGAGVDFIVNSVENVLKIGGIACHTTELNLSSDEDTIEGNSDTVLYRRKDILSLIEMLRNRGHEVSPFLINPCTHYCDTHVDTPPYSHDIHLKLKLAGYVTTSVGLIIKRGR